MNGRKITEKYSDKKLQNMQETCKCLGFTKGTPSVLSGICSIALIEINRELDTRKIRKEIKK